jgi:tRNA A-37 threonylcarbamoyl transferase component Bud32
VKQVIDARIPLAPENDTVAERKEDFVVYRLNSSEAKTALDALLTDPDRLLGGSEVLAGRGSNCHTVKIDIGGHLYVLKRFDCCGWLHRMKYISRQSRAVRNWLTSLEFTAKGIAVPRPILCMEERKFRLLGRSYFLSEYVRNARPLSELWSSLARTNRQKTLANLAAFLGRLHRSGCIHGDTNWRNILICDDMTAKNILLVDFDCSKVFSRPMPDKIHKDVQHFLRDLDRLAKASPEDFRFFLKCWQSFLPDGMKNEKVFSPNDYQQEASSK